MLALLFLGVLTTCDHPAPHLVGAAATAHRAVQVRQATLLAAYIMDTVRIDRESRNGLTVQVAYPRLRPRSGTAPADTAGVQAFNREAKLFATSLVKEINATARENWCDRLTTGLQVRFKTYLLQQGLASVAFTINQDGIGPRPTTWSTGLTYDLRSARKVQSADLFPQNDAFKAIIIKTLQPLITGVEECQLNPDNMAWDNFALSSDAYYLLLGDDQIGRACETRAVRVPFTKLQPFAKPGSPATRLH